MRYRIPFKLLQPHVEKYLSGLKLTEEEGYDLYGPEVQALADRADIHPDTLSKCLRGDHAGMDELMADRLVCAMGIPMIWHEDLELKKEYWHGQVPPNPMMPVKCKNPKCDEWLELVELATTGAVAGATKYSKQVYCDNNCKAQAQRARRPKAHARAVMKHRRRNQEAWNTYMREYRQRKTRERQAARAAA